MILTFTLFWLLRYQLSFPILQSQKIFVQKPKPKRIFKPDSLTPIQHINHRISSNIFEQSLCCHAFLWNTLGSQQLLCFTYKSDLPFLNWRTEQISQATGPDLRTTDMSNSTQPPGNKKKNLIIDSSVTKFLLCNPSDTSQIYVCINLDKHLHSN